jgi:hypothetical protein
MREARSAGIRFFGGEVQGLAFEFRYGPRPNIRRWMSLEISLPAVPGHRRYSGTPACKQVVWTRMS